MSSENQEQNNPELDNNQDLEKKEELQKKDLIEKFESSIDWNLISIFSIWIFLTFTFFCIFVKY